MVYFFPQPLTFNWGGIVPATIVTLVTEDANTFINLIDIFFIVQPSHVYVGWLNEIAYHAFSEHEVTVLKSTFTSRPAFS